MENKFKDRDISFETLEKAVNGDCFAMQEVIRLFKPYMARLSIEVTSIFPLFIILPPFVFVLFLFPN